MKPEFVYVRDGQHVHVLGPHGFRYTFAYTLLGEAEAIMARAVAMHDASPVVRELRLVGQAHAELLDVVELRRAIGASYDRPSATVLPPRRAAWRRWLGL